MPSRRRTLAVLATAAGIAGCVESPGRSETPDGTPTATPPPSETSGSPETPDSPATPDSPETDDSETNDSRGSVGDSLTVAGQSVRLWACRVQKSGYRPTSPDSMAVTDPDGAQFLLCRVRVEDGAFDASAFRLEVDGETYRGNAAVDDHYSVGGYEALYDSEYGEGLLVFRVPAPAPADPPVAVRLRDAAWRLSRGAVERLRRPETTFALAAFETPDRIDPDEGFTVRVRARNTGDVPGVFRGVLNVAGYRYAFAPFPFEIDLAAGESGTWQKEFPTVTRDVTGDVGLFLRTAIGDRTRRVPFVTPTPTE